MFFGDWLPLMPHKNKFVVSYICSETYIHYYTLKWTIGDTCTSQCEGPVLKDHNHDLQWRQVQLSLFDRYTTSTDVTILPFHPGHFLEFPYYYYWQVLVEVGLHGVPWYKLVITLITGANLITDVVIRITRISVRKTSPRMFDSSSTYICILVFR